jgi:quercetin dioxygenase-like cupin family protein
MERFRVFSIESLEQKKGKIHRFRDLVPENAMPNVDLRYINMKPGERIKNHIHEQSETLIVTIKGKGRVHLDGNEYDVKPGDVAYATMGCPHGYEAVDQEWEYIIIQAPTIRLAKDKRDYISVDESPDNL